MKQIQQTLEASLEDFSISRSERKELEQLLADTDLLLTGSYNWTRSASSENNENILVTNNRKLVLSFHQEFERLWKTLN